MRSAVGYFVKSFFRSSVSSRDRDRGGGTLIAQKQHQTAKTLKSEAIHRDCSWLGTQNIGRRAVKKCQYNVCFFGLQ